eukprot:4350650-Prymnesium_polylepis.1
MSSVATQLYISHTLLELVLGAIKLRGTYSGFEMPPGTEKFARHHGVALLSLALLGALVLARRLIDTAAGEVCSTVLAFFHAGAVIVMLHALNGKVVLLHLPWALGFAWHVWSVRQRPKSSVA